MQESVLSKIKEVQNEYKEVQKYKDIIEVCKPGDTGFVCRKIGTSGYLLLSIIKIEPRERKVLIKEKINLSLEDFKGVYPYMAIVMESASEQYAPGDIVLFDYKTMQGNAIDIVVKGGLGVLVPEHSILGIDKNYTL